MNERISEKKQRLEEIKDLVLAFSTDTYVVDLIFFPEETSETLR